MQFTNTTLVGPAHPPFLQFIKLNVFIDTANCVLATIRTSPIQISSKFLNNCLSHCKDFVILCQAAAIFLYRSPRVAKKLHSLFVIKNIYFYFFPDDSYASAAHSGNIVVGIYTVCLNIIKTPKWRLFLPEFRIAGVPSKIRTFQIVAHKLK
jgi:hypothetical protein